MALDLVRGLAALAVVLNHLRVGHWVEFGALPVEQQGFAFKVLFLSMRFGHEAVMVFFVLSGFLVGGNLINRVRGGTFSIGDYVLDRSTRVLIPLAPACALTVGINYLAFGEPVNFVQALGNMLGLNGVLVDGLSNNAPLWSLAFEVWFYVLAGAVATLFTGLATPVALVALLLSLLVFTKLGAFYLLLWTVGALTSQVTRLAWSERLLLPGVLLFLFGVTAYQLGATSKSFLNVTILSGATAEALICFGFSLCLPYLCSDAINEALKPIRALVTFLSGISFSLYLVHFPINVWLRAVIPTSGVVDGSSILCLALKLAVVLAAATFFWFVFERSSFSVRQAGRAFLERGRVEKFSQPAR